MNTSWMQNEGLTPVDQHLGKKSKVDAGTDPDAPGSQDLVYIFRFGYSLQDSVTKVITEIPDIVLKLPRWRAVEMIQNREARAISDEEAQPYLDRQRVIEQDRATAAQLEAQRFLNQLREQKGEIPDIKDSVSNERIDELENKIKSQGEKLDAILDFLKPKE